jgi:transmembrane sensor
LLRGEAHFQVAKDAERPFVVSARGVEVRAVGTAFSVQMDAAVVEVVVTEGRVAVDTPRPPAAPELAAERAPVDVAPLPEPAGAVLDAGHRASIRVGEAAPEISQLAPPELSKRLSWRVPQLEFSRTRLGEIVALVNEHGGERGRKRIVIDPAFADLSEVKLSGFLAADNTLGLVRLLETNFPVEAAEGVDEIVLRRRG